LSQLRQVLRKKRGGAKILASVAVSFGLDDIGKELQILIVFTRTS